VFRHQVNHIIFEVFFILDVSPPRFSLMKMHLCLVEKFSVIYELQHKHIIP